MINIVDFISQFFKSGEIRAETENVENSLPKPSRGYDWFWPRLLFFNSNQNHHHCEEDKGEEEYESPTTEICIELKDAHLEKNGEDEQDQNQDQDQEEQEEHENGDEENDLCTCPENGDFRQELGCIYRNAKFGLKEGTLTGVFLGGALGIYKYIDNVYKKGERSEGGGGGSDNAGESTVNENIIFVTAINSAIAMGVFCTLWCSGRGIMYC